MTSKSIILTLIVISCSSQLNNVLCELRKIPLVLQTSESKTFEKLTKDVSTVSIALANTLRSEYHIPSLVNKNNVVDLTNKIVGPYNSHVDNEDAKLKIDEIIAKYGFPVEEHSVQTEDGYILSMFRIPGNGSVVFLMHGILSSADDFITAGPESGLAYLLAMEGYDVWMGNARGNKHSRCHVSLLPSEAVFWDFSWHEIGVYDMPAMIDYVLNTTNKTSLKYIGHSQGTTSFFVMASEKKDYNGKIDLMVALSPVAFMGKVKSPIIQILSPGGPLIETAAKIFGFDEFLPDNTITKVLRDLMCGKEVLAEILCNNIMFLFGGFDVEQTNATNLPVLFAHMPSGAATKQLAHYGQNVVVDGFRKFDYGIINNIERYGALRPPDYEVEDISAPIALFYSDADWLAQPEDVNKLKKKLGNVVHTYKVPNDKFNHFDFLYAIDIKKLIFDKLRELLRLY